MKTAGIIGGLGPETTSQFYLEVIFGCYEKDKTNRPPILIWNVPLPYKIEEEFITKGQGEKKYIPFLIEAAQRLEKGGADFIVIPCNSVHIFIDKVRNAVSIPVLSIVEETVRFLRDENIKETGILATSATIRSRLYDSVLSKNEIVVHAPSGEDQSRMGIIINNLVHSRQNTKDKKQLLEITDKFVANGVNTILLACTDLQLITPKTGSARIIDTMEILAQATVREILA